MGDVAATESPRGGAEARRRRFGEVIETARVGGRGAPEARGRACEVASEAYTGVGTLLDALRGVREITHRSSRGANGCPVQGVHAQSNAVEAGAKQPISWRKPPFRSRDLTLASRGAGDIIFLPNPTLGFAKTNHGLLHIFAPTHKPGV